MHFGAVSQWRRSIELVDDKLLLLFERNPDRSESIKVLDPLV